MLSKRFFRFAQNNRLSAVELEIHTSTTLCHDCLQQSKDFSFQPWHFSMCQPHCHISKQTRVQSYKPSSMLIKLTTNKFSHCQSSTETPKNDWTSIKITSSRRQQPSVYQLQAPVQKSHKYISEGNYAISTILHFPWTGKLNTVSSFFHSWKHSNLYNLLFFTFICLHLMIIVMYCFQIVSPLSKQYSMIPSFYSN